jgi:hypothetical protein
MPEPASAGPATGAKPDGAQLGASALYSEVRPGDIRRLNNDVTKTESFEVRGSIVPLQSQKSTLTLTAALAFTNVTEHDVFGPFYMDHIRTARLTSDYRRLPAARQFRRPELPDCDLAPGS